MQSNRETPPTLKRCLGLRETITISAGTVIGVGSVSYTHLDVYKRQQYKGMDSVTLEENLTGFADGDQVSSWAVSAMNWAVGQGIMNGKGNNTLDPQGTATRAEVAKMLMVYLELK